MAIDTPQKRASALLEPGVYFGTAVTPATGSPKSTRVWVAGPERPRANSGLVAHGSDTELYGVDFDDVLPSGVVIQSVLLSQENLAEAAALTLGTPGVNTAEFTGPGGAVPVGRGVVFDIAGGDNQTDYQITVRVDCSDGRTRNVACGLLAWNGD